MATALGLPDAVQTCLALPMERNLPTCLALPIASFRGLQNQPLFTASKSIALTGLRAYSSQRARNYVAGRVICRVAERAAEIRAKANILLAKVARTHHWAIRCGRRRLRAVKRPSNPLAKPALKEWIVYATEQRGTQAA